MHTTLHTQLAAANVCAVALTGGEPLMRHDFWELVDAIRAQHIAVIQVYSNGLLLTDEVLAGFKQRGMHCEFVISFDGCDCHDWLRGVPGSEKKTVAAMRRVKEHGFRLSVATTLHAGNIASLHPTYELLKTIGVDSWKTSEVVEAGNWKKQSAERLLPDVLYQAYLKILPQYMADQAPFNLMLGSFFYCSQHSRKYIIPYQRGDGTEKTLRQPLCRCCRTVAYALPNGTLLPCMPMSGTYIEQEMPNVFKQQITDILQQSHYFDLINMRVGEIAAENGCEQCAYLYKCAAGCRAAAINTCGDVRGKDRQACHFWQGGYAEKISAVLGRSPDEGMLTEDTRKDLIRIL